MASVALSKRAAAALAASAAARALAGQTDVASASMSNPSRTARPGCGPAGRGCCGGSQPSRVTGSTRTSAATLAHATQAAMRLPSSPAAACAETASQHCPWKQSNGAARLHPCCSLLTTHLSLCHTLGYLMSASLKQNTTAFGVARLQGSSSQRGAIQRRSLLAAAPTAGGFAALGTLC